MSIPEHTLCGWHKSELKAKFLLKVIEPPKYYCKDCGRIAAKKKWLCEPKKLHKDEDPS